MKEFRSAVKEHGLLLSKNDDDKEPPKGFEKFFRKRNERKSAKENDQDSKGKLLLIDLINVSYR